MFINRICKLEAFSFGQLPKTDPEIVSSHLAASILGSRVSSHLEASGYFLGCITTENS
jgi:hypothetical protein